MGKVRGQGTWRSQWPRERVGKPSLFFGSTSLLLRCAWERAWDWLLESGTPGPSQPRASPCREGGPGGWVVQQGGGEWGSPSPQPPHRAVLGGNETSSCVCLPQKCTRRREPKPTHARIGAPTRACTLTGTSVHAPKHGWARKHVCVVWTHHTPPPPNPGCAAEPSIAVLFCVTVTKSPEKPFLAPPEPGVPPLQGWRAARGWWVSGLG